jgi:mannitol/fructose-specific phosphotransferase system IIA component (Ntr-type)
MGVEFTDFLPESNIVEIHGKDKKSAINELLDFAARSSKLDKDILHDAVWERENQLSTAIGHGLAVPHARLNKVEMPVVMLGICTNKINDYCGIDKEPVSLIFLIICDRKDHQLYLDILQSVSGKLFKNKKLIQSIHASKADGVRIKKLLTPAPQTV